ncbi:MAG: spirocyclase AveC family protein [Nocardia sp.]|nr:spirocyclase AveC family protein [Nocardia sp.]
MTDLSNKAAPTVTEKLGAATTSGGEKKSGSKAVYIWSTIGGLILILQVYVWIRWVTGPYFQRVPTGPTDPPAVMRTILVIWTSLIILGLPISFYFFIIRPWVRERRITLDGMLMVSMGLMFFQDPFLNYLNTWCTYNTWLWNRGSWTPYIPGWVSPDEPGHQVAEPLLMNAPGYAFGVLLMTIVGCWLMRKAKQRWPGINALGLIAIVMVFAYVVDFVMEGLVLSPMGLYTFPGSIRAFTLNAGHYYQWPLYEGLMWGGVQAALCCLRYFTDDRGRTIVERGLDNVRGGIAKQQLVRFLAIFGAVSASFFLLYNVPAQWFGMHADPWPSDVMKRSYFLGGICGEGTNKPCPDPSLPINTRKSVTIDQQGHVVIPDGVHLPAVTPIEHNH